MRRRSIPSNNLLELVVAALAGVGWAWPTLHRTALRKSCCFHDTLLRKRYDMNTLKLLGLGGALLGSIAFAQGPNPYNGKWLAKFQDKRGGAQEAELSVKDDGGTWKVWGTSRDTKRNPCIGRDLPITVKLASTEGLAFRIEGSKVLAGCPDGSVTLKRVDDKTLEGQFGDGRTLTLVRE